MKYVVKLTHLNDLVSEVVVEADTPEEAAEKARDRFVFNCPEAFQEIEVH